MNKIINCGIIVTILGVITISCGKLTELSDNSITVTSSEEEITSVFTMSPEVDKITATEFNDTTSIDKHIVNAEEYGDSVQRIEGPTQNGGAYGIIYYVDDNNNFVPEAEALYFIYDEYDENGKVIVSTQGYTEKYMQEQATKAEVTTTSLYSADECMQRIEGPTKNGGAYAIVYYYDDYDNPVPKSMATKVFIEEYNELDVVIKITYAVPKNKQETEPN